MITKGQKINERYEILRSIGEGGMANVYLAKDTILDRLVAVKILRGDLSNDDKFVRRFQREAISSSSLSHPNIVEMYDVGEDSDKYYIVMEYVQGKTLKNLIKRRGALTLDETLDIMTQLTEGISHAHDGYIIHRDIKPQNVMILDDGMVKITDFGIAMALNGDELTQTNSVMGSVHYLPPEQANGTGSTIKSDVYSLGILMYELLTGRIPFKGENAVEIAIKQMKDKMPSVRAVKPEIPQSVENIILKACAKNPKNRYESAKEMLEDLKNCLNEERKSEKRHVYVHPEQEVEKTKKLSNLNPFKSEKSDSNKEFNKKPLIIGGIVFLAMLILITIVALVLPLFSRVPEVRVPDVSGLSYLEAEEILLDHGLLISLDEETEYSETIEEGYIVATSPRASRLVKEGTEITLIISLGSNQFVLEDYTGRNIFEVKAILETNGIIVEEEIKEVDNIENLTEFTIVDQMPKEGEAISEGDVVTLYLPELIVEYPDFREEGWTEEQVRNFADQYNIELTVDYKETDELSDSFVLDQSRAPGTTVRSHVMLRVTVAVEPEEEEVEEINNNDEEIDAQG